MAGPEQTGYGKVWNPNVVNNEWKKKIEMHEWDTKGLYKEHIVPNPISTHGDVTIYSENKARSQLRSATALQGRSDKYKAKLTFKQKAQSVETALCYVADTGSQANFATRSKMVPKMLAAARFQEAPTQPFIQTSASSLIFG